MRYAGLKKQQIQELVRTGLERLAEGQWPFEKDYPVSASKMRETLRSWRQSDTYRRLHRAAAGDDPQGAET
jgi:hypothetical protein